MKSPDPIKNQGTTGICPNCGQSNTEKIVGFHDRTPDKPGKQYNPYSTNKPMYVEKGGPMVMPLAFGGKKIKTAQKPHTIKSPKVRDEWISEPFKQMKRPKKINNDIIDIDEVSDTCKDLAIDG